MLTAEERARILPFWATFVCVIAIYFLFGSFWKAAFIGVFVVVSSLLGFGTRRLLQGSFAITVLAIAVALGLLPPDLCLQLIHEA